MYALRLGICGLAMVLFLAATASAQGVGGKPMRFIVGFPPGGAVDLIARAVAPGIGEALGAQVVVENRGGANGAIGAELVAKSPPDGSAIGLVSIGSLVLNVHMLPNPTYHTLRDFTPISRVGLVPFAITLHPAVPAKSLKELIALARSRPGRITIGSPGTGSLQHLTVEMLNAAANVSLLHVPYKGTGPAMTDVMGGHIDGMVTAISGVLAAAKANKLRVVAVTGEQRAPSLPQVPTAQEQGIPNFLVVNWYAIVGPANVPAAPLNAVHNAILKTVASPAVHEKLVTSGVDPAMDSTPAAFAAFLAEDFARWEKVVKRAKLQP